jgi:hypothetical protein
MLMKRGDFDYAYNAQACVDEDHGVIVAADRSAELTAKPYQPGLRYGTSP